MSPADSSLRDSALGDSVFGLGFSFCIGFTGLGVSTSSRRSTGLEVSALARGFTGLGVSASLRVSGRAYIFASFSASDIASFSASDNASATTSSTGSATTSATLLFLGSATVLGSAVSSASSNSSPKLKVICLTS